MQTTDNATLQSLLQRSSQLDRCYCHAANGSVRFSDILAGSCFSLQSHSFDGRSVLLATPDHLTTAIAMIKLDGHASRIVLCPPDVDPKHFETIVSAGQIDIIACGENGSDFGHHGLPVVRARPEIQIQDGSSAGKRRTEWVLLTSGTGGTPKLVLHDLASLIGAIKPLANVDDTLVWASFYDIRRYGGLQIFLRAVVQGTSLILSQAGEPVGAYLGRLQKSAVTHISGTPSHWRWALLSGAANMISPTYVRLSGEIVDQSILDALQATYPRAAISHAFASTEAGVGFDVIDGREGFSATVIDGQPLNAEVSFRIVDGSLQIRSNRTASRYLGNGQPPIVGPEGFVDTGDIVELRGDRYYFAGRREGVINVGGQKIFPEEVENVINSHPQVQMSLVHGRRNPMMGALVVADVVLESTSTDRSRKELAAEILSRCREALPAYKVPVKVSFVQSLDVSAAGKLLRKFS
jgi:acyl-CoA synthetase (AMP-forming)/AMP-acid ligase II